MLDRNKAADSLLGVIALMSTFTFLACGGFLFAAIFASAGYFLRVKIRRRLDSALVARGTVVSLEQATAMSSDSLQKVYHPVFTFCDVHGVEHRIRSEVGSYPATHRVGDAVEVFYHPQSPHEAVIDPKDFVQMARICIFAAVLAVVFATIILILERHS